MNENLSQRERQIAALVAEELTDGEIAYRLGVSRQYIKNVMMDIRRKIGVVSRVGVAMAVVRGEVAR